MHHKLFIERIVYTKSSVICGLYKCVIFCKICITLFQINSKILYDLSVQGLLYGKCIWVLFIENFFIPHQTCYIVDRMPTPSRNFNRQFVQDESTGRSRPTSVYRCKNYRLLFTKQMQSCLGRFPPISCSGQQPLIADNDDNV